MAKYRFGDYVTIKDVPDRIAEKTSYRTGTIDRDTGGTCFVCLPSKDGEVHAEVLEENLVPARKLRLHWDDIRVEKDGDALTMDYDDDGEHIAVAWYNTWFDVDAYFGTETRGDDSAWVNFCTYTYLDGSMKAFYFVETDESSLCVPWALNEDEKGLLSGLLEERAKRDGYESLKDFMESEIGEMERN